MITQFKQIIGQSSSIVLLQRALERGNFPRLAILAGNHGTGKSTTALIVAMSLLCEHPVGGEPCMKCGSCRAVAAAIGKNASTSRFSRVNMAETTGKDSFTELLKNIFVLQVSSSRCVYVLEEMHAVRDKVLQTALLERIDAMPPDVYIIMTTTELNDLIPPLKSRAQVFRFNRISKKDSSILLLNWCANHFVRMDEDIKDLIIGSAKGVPRDMVNLAEFVSTNAVTKEELVNYLNMIDVSELIELFSTFTEEQMMSSVVASDRLLKEHDHALVVQQLKTFILDVIYLIEGSVQGSFTGEQADILRELFTGVSLLQIASVCERLNSFSSEYDVKFAFLKMRQIMRNKSIKNIMRDTEKTVSSQSKEADSAFSQKRAILRRNSNQTEELSKEGFLDLMNVFGGGRNEGGDRSGG